MIWPLPVVHRSADRGNTGLAFLDTLGTLIAVQNTTGGSAVHWKQRPLRNDPAQPVRGLQRHHATATLPFRDVQLHALTGLVAERRENRPRRDRRAGTGPQPPAPDGSIRTRDRTGLAGRGAPSRATRGQPPADEPSLAATPSRLARPARSRGVLARALRITTPLSMTPTPLTLSIDENHISESETRRHA